MAGLEFELTPKQQQEIEQLSPVLKEKLTNSLQRHRKELVNTEEGKWLNTLTLLAEFFVWNHMGLFTILLPAVLFTYL
ncbi:MAG: hypothetical protein WC243_03600, partial [Patescibacteria group bacterium]